MSGSRCAPHSPRSPYQPPPHSPPSFTSVDFFSNRQLLLAYGNDIVIKGNYMYSSTVNPDEESEVTLRVSVNAAPFLPCRFPYKLNEHE